MFAVTSEDPNASQRAVQSADVMNEDLGCGALGTMINVIWLLLAGWWLGLGHVITAIGLAITIIGIPFAWAHLKLAALSLWPIGKTVVTTEEAENLQRRTGRA